MGVGTVHPQRLLLLFLLLLCLLVWKEYEDTKQTLVCAFVQSSVQIPWKLPV